MSDERRVLVVFSDGSLGGTSRSALMMGAAWRRAGAAVDFAPLDGVHPERVEEFRTIGGLVDAGGVRVADYRLIHLHHAQVGERELGPLARWAAQAGAAAPALLTHNVFGVPGVPLERWPGPVAVGLLGEWLVAQFIDNCWPARVPPIVVVPNPQDLDFFRPPTAQERQRARERTGTTAGRPVVLRVGSPIKDKWSSAYAPLADEVAKAGGTLVCVGTPPELVQRLQGHPAVRLLDRTADGTLLRDLYWSADVLAVDAKQGESFGNVILEALGSGTPVVYRDRPTRDNTPREFPVVISSGRGAWIRDVLAVADGRRAQVDRAAIERYSVDGVAAVLRILLDGDLGAEAIAQVARRDARIGTIADRAAVALRHLPPGRTALAAARAGKRTAERILASHQG